MEKYEIEILKSVMEQCDKFRPFDGYAENYYRAMPESVEMYGVKGLRTQVLYFLNNVRAKTEEQKKIKKALTKWGQEQ